MQVNIEFFDREPIENLITCLNFKMDKVIYFGHDDVMTNEKQEETKAILKRLCGIENVEFYTVSQKDLSSIVDRMTQVLLSENQAGNQCFFDLTGGEDLILVAMGILSKEYQTPMHQYDIAKDKLHILNKKEIAGITQQAEPRKIILSLDDIIGFHGGKIDYRHHKLAKTHLEDEAFAQAFEVMWEIAKVNPKVWNGISSILKDCTHYENEYFNVSVEKSRLEGMIKKRPEVGAFQRFSKYLRRLEKGKIITEFKGDSKRISFTYNDEIVRDCLLDAGCILELATYYKRKASGEYSDCRIGVHIDWDGVFQGPGLDVENEVDVMLLSGNIPVFISCKNGKVDQMALYELDTVARRFGGKYVKKELVASQEIASGYLRRAEEMGIMVNQ